MLLLARNVLDGRYSVAHGPVRGSHAGDMDACRKDRTVLAAVLQLVIDFSISIGNGLQLRDALPLRRPAPVKHGRALYRLDRSGVSSSERRVGETDRVAGGLD